jgi:hypothetical protein
MLILLVCGIKEDGVIIKKILLILSTLDIENFSQQKCLQTTWAEEVLIGDQEYGKRYLILRHF